MTIGQILRKKKVKNIKEKLQPQYKGTVLSVFTMAPKKPNSALRKVVKVQLNKTKKIVTAYCIGENAKLVVHNQILVRPNKTPDLPGVKYKVLRGVLDMAGVLNRKSSKSKYGSKKK